MGVPVPLWNPPGYAPESAASIEQERDRLVTYRSRVNLPEVATYRVHKRREIVWRSFRLTFYFFRL